MKKHILIVKEFVDNLEKLETEYKKLNQETYLNDYLFKIIHGLLLNEKKKYDGFELTEEEYTLVKTSYEELKNYIWIRDLLVDILNNNEEIDPVKFTEEEVGRNRVLLENINEKIKLLETLLIKYNFEF